MPSCSDQYLDSHGIQPTAQQISGHSMIVTYLTNRLLFRPSHPKSIFSYLILATAVSLLHSSIQ